MKAIKLTETLYQLTERFPELIDVLAGLGLAGVANPVVRNTVGRTMVLQDGAQKMGVPLHRLIEVLESHGFTVESESVGT